MHGNWPFYLFYFFKFPGWPCSTLCHHPYHFDVKEVLDNNKIKQESMGRSHLILCQCKIKYSTRKRTALMGWSFLQTHNCGAQQWITYSATKPWHHWAIRNPSLERNKEGKSFVEHSTRMTHTTKCGKHKRVNEPISTSLICCLYFLCFSRSNLL